jgi:hypothetical protein
MTWQMHANPRTALPAQPLEILMANPPSTKATCLCGQEQPRGQASPVSVRSAEMRVVSACYSKNVRAPFERIDGALDAQLHSMGKGFALRAARGASFQSRDNDSQITKWRRVRSHRAQGACASGRRAACSRMRSTRTAEVARSILHDQILPHAARGCARRGRLGVDGCRSRRRVTSFDAPHLSSLAGSSIDVSGTPDHGVTRLGDTRVIGRRHRETLCQSAGSMRSAAR